MGDPRGRRLRVAVMMGGRSGEHDVSLASGRAALANLPAERFEAFPVVLGRDGGWRFPEATEGATGDAGAPLPEGLRALLDRRPDVVFLAMHGPEGEDGKLQSLMELVGLPYTGSDPYASSLAMDKPVSKRVLAAAGIPVAEDLVVTRDRWRAAPAATVASVRARFTPPWVLKTPRLGSSVGLDVVPADGDLEGALAGLFAFDREVLVEEFVAGRELTGGVLDWPPAVYERLGVGRPAGVRAQADGGELLALPLVEITPLGDPFFNYHAKYTLGAAREICPAPIDAGITARLQDLSVRAHRALGCRGFSRTDFIVAEGGRIVCLETNTIPGLTETSLLPQAAAAAGIDFPSLVSGMVLAAAGERDPVGESGPAGEGAPGGAPTAP